MTDRRQRLIDEANSARTEALALLDGLTEEQSNAPTINEGWSVKDTAAHLASIEARVRLMLETVLNDGTWAADRADLDAFNTRAVEERRSRSADAILRELRETGQETANLFAKLTADDLDREWMHPIFGAMSIERTAGIIAGHLRSHVRDLRSTLQR